MRRDYLGKVLEFLTITMFLGVFLTVMVQIITRYLPVSYPWTEELSRMLFVGAVFFCAPIAYRDYEFVIVDILVDLMPKGIRKFVNLITSITIIVLFAVILKYGITLTTNGHRQLMPTLGIPMSTAYVLIPFSAVCFIYYATLNMIRDVRGLLGMTRSEREA
jgi:TRAP-type C4-dicarboxylate transport system permease small subunit